MTVSLAYDATLSRVRITVTGLTDLAPHIVERSTNQITWRTVRGGAAVMPSAGGFILDDFEFNADTVNHYRVSGPSTWDMFGRTVSPGWGVDDTGQAYTTGGGVAGDYSVSGGSGRISMDVLNSSRRVVLPATYGDFRRLAKLGVSVVGVGDDIETTLMGRYQDAANYLQASIFWDGDSTFAEARLVRRVGGAATTLATETLPFTQAGSGLAAWMLWDAVGDAHRLKVWAANAAEPADWTITAVDATWASGQIGFRGNLQPGFSGSLPVEMTVDDHVVSVPAAVLFSDDITPVLDAVWLKSIARPFLNRIVQVSRVGDVTRPTRTGLHDVVGRSFPVAVTDVRGSARWDMVLRTTTPEQASTLELILSTGDILLIHTPAASTVPGGYVTVGQTGEHRFGPVNPTRHWTLPLTKVAAPGADVVGATVTWQGVSNTYATWADLIAAQASWASTLELIGDPTDVIVP